jgi:nucleolin
LDGSEVDGRNIHVEKTTPKEDRQNTGGQRREPFGAKPQTERDPDSTTVFVGNLSYNTTEDSVTQIFESCGKIKGVRLAKDREGNVK